MPPFRKLSDKVSVAGCLNPADFSEIKVLGFDKIINFRPDNEAHGQIPSVEAAAAARGAGLAYAHIPVSKHDLFTDTVVATAAAELRGKGRVLAYCASGQRAAIVWAAVAARSNPVDAVLLALHSAGFDLGFIRDDLDAQADRSRWSDQGAEAAIADAPRNVTSLDAAA